MGIIRHEGGRLINGLKWSSRVNNSPLKVLIAGKESEERGERGHFEGGGKELPLR